MAPRRRYGQHFLIDRRLAERVAEAVAGLGHTACLEVGPGLGALTGLLLERGLAVTAVEIDRGLCAYLRSAFGSRLVLVEGDILRLQAGALVDAATTAWCGNLPYYLTAPLLRRALADPFPAYVAMVQREVGDRLTAPPGAPERGGLSVVVQALCEVERLSSVPPAAFYPRPEVASVVVRLTRRAQPAWDPLGEGAERLLRALFGHRRKGVRQGLRQGLELPPAVVESVLERAAVDPMKRPQDMSLAELASLTEAVEAQAVTAHEGRGRT
jgi:16S rRNA (adenine1518-N6/adenine1519-N6)-dimethyltransferase